MIKALRKVAKTALPDGRTIRTLPFGIARGIRLGVDFQDGQIGMYLGLYEIELNRHLRKLCPPGTACFDIGGQMGYDALIMAKLTGSAVVTVECDPKWCEVIRSNAHANPSLEPLLSLREGFVDETNDPGTGRITLDAVASETFVPGFVKIDIEGGEAAALKGADRVLSEMPGLLIEVHSAQLERECDGLLRSRGYDPFVVDQRSWLPDHRPLAHNRWIIAPGTRAG